jgi:hypothetical protein
MVIQELRLCVLCVECDKSNWILVEPSPQTNLIIDALTCIYCKRQVEVTVYIEDKKEE